MNVFPNKSESIGQLLIQKGLVKTEALQRALAEQEKFGGLIGDALIRLGFISEDALYLILAEQFAMEFVKLKSIAIDVSVINEVPAKFACHYALMPLKIEDNLLTIAISHPLDLHVRDDICRLSQ